MRTLPAHAPSVNAGPHFIPPSPPKRLAVPIPPPHEPEPCVLFQRTNAGREAYMRGQCDGFRGRDHQDKERWEVLPDYLEGRDTGNAMREDGIAAIFGARDARTVPVGIASDF